MTEGIGTGLTTAVLISGSGTNLQAIIDQVQDGGLASNLVAVVSDNPSAFGLQRARRVGIPTFVVDYTDFSSRAEAEAHLGTVLRDLNPELVVLAGFMRILPADIVQQFPGRMLNIHPSLLPKYRGLNTYRRVLAGGDAWHGSTVHYVTPELDSGPSIIQYRVRIGPQETEDSLMERVQRGEYIIYPRVISWIEAGRLRLIGDEVSLDGKILEQPVLVEEGGLSP